MNYLKTRGFPSSACAEFGLHVFDIQEIPLGPKCQFRSSQRNVTSDEMQGVGQWHRMEGHGRSIWLTKRVGGEIKVGHGLKAKKQEVF